MDIARADPCGYEEARTQLELLQGTLEDLIGFPPDGDIHAYVARTVRRLAPPGTIVLVQALDPGSRTIALRAFDGLGSLLPGIEAVLGRPLAGLSFRVPESVIASMLTGEFHRIGGLRELSFGELPDEVCRRIESQPFFGAVYSTGISWKGALDGTVTCILRPGEELARRGAMTAFIRQVAAHLQRRRAEEQARTSAELYRTLAESTRDVVLVLDPRGIIRYINRPAAALIGTAPEALVGRDLADYLPAELVAEMRRVLSVAVPSAETITTDTASPLRAGGRLWFNTQVVPLLDSGGRAREYLVVSRDITDRKTAEIALKEKQDQLALAMSAAEMGFWTWDLAADERRVSTGPGLLFGYTERELEEQFRHYEEYAHPGDSLNRGDISDARDENGEPATAEFDRRIRAKDGSWRWMRIRGRVMARDPEGRPLLMTGILRDVTDEKRTAMQLDASEARSRMFVEKFRGIAYRADPDGLPAVFHGSVEQLTGYEDREIARGAPRWDRLIHPEDLPKAAAAGSPDALLRAPGSCALREYRLVRKDGAVRWVSDFVQSQVGENGEPFLEGFVTDITERKEAETAVRERSEEVNQFFNLALDLFCIGDADGRFLVVNRAWETTLGLPVEEIPGRQFREFVHPDDFAEYVEAVAHLRSRGLLLDYKTRIRCADGTYHWIECRASFTGGRIYAAVRDITERTRLEDAFRLTNRQLNILTSVTRHDILNKVTVIVGYLVMAKELVADPTAAKFLGEIESATETIKDQIEFTRLYQEIGIREPVWLRLDDLMPRPHVPPGVAFCAELEGYRVYADPMLASVFFNLLDNSLRHGRTVTTVRVSCREADDELRVFWEDDGVGVPRSEKERIFERGYGSNTGLGLFLIREILGITGMRIVETGEPGGGVRFELVAPRGNFGRE